MPRTQRPYVQDTMHYVQDTTNKYKEEVQEKKYKEVPEKVAQN
jgi:hypothetical protein